MNCRTPAGNKCPFEMPPFEVFVDAVSRDYKTASDYDPDDPEDLKVLRDNYDESASNIRDFCENPRIYRLMGVDDAEDFTDGIAEKSGRGEQVDLGEHWSMQYPRIDVLVGIGKKDDVEMEAVANPADLDPVATMVYQTAYPTEGEVVLKPGSVAKLRRINDRKFDGVPFEIG